MIDRFDDADPANNDQGVDEYDPADPSHYSGGDLAGITRRLEYIKGLGATALWITPPVANQWWSNRPARAAIEPVAASDYTAETRCSARFLQAHENYRLPRNGYRRCRDRR